MMKILVIGAGRSSSSLIRYLLKCADSEGWEILVADQDEALVRDKINGHSCAKACVVNALDKEERHALIQGSNLVISMLPARFHPEIVRHCIEERKNIITPSYVSDDVRAMHDDAVNAGIIILNEIGVDPGIDHMSAMRVIDSIREQGGEMQSFKSFTGGLVAPESDNNPWNYKFTWNPRNVVLAGQGGAAKFIRDGRYKYIPYHQLFGRTEHMHIEGYGEFEGYANRDSLSYRETYGLQDIPTIFRGTMRRPGYCRAWNSFVQLGMTDDTYTIEDSASMTFRQFTNSFLAFNPSDSVELKLKHYLGLEHNSEIFRMLEWLGIFEETMIPLENATPAQILQHILEQKWTLAPDDKDMIVMWHQFAYTLQGKTHEIESSMISIGEDQTYTGMSNTVGLPVGIAAKLILKGDIQEKGVQLPIIPSIYNAILDELATLGVSFTEREVY